MTEKSREKHTRNYTDKSVVIGGWNYLLSALPEKERDALALEGLVLVLSRQETPREFYEDLRTGARSLVKAEKAPKIDPWRQAAANVHARAELKGLGIKPPPGKRLDDTPEFAEKVAKALELSKAWDRATLNKVKGHGLVVAEYQKLTGGGDDLSAMFAAPVAADIVKPQAEHLSEAAD